MSRTLSSPFQTYAALSTKRPCVIMSVNGITRRYSSVTFNNITANDKKYIQAFSASLLNIDVKNAQTKPSSFQCKISNGESTSGVPSLDVSEQFVVDNNIFEEDVTYSLGFQEMDDTDFVDLPVQKIQGINHSDPVSLEFISSDARRLINDNQMLFNFPQKTQLNGALTATAGTVTVDDTTGFIDENGNIPSEIRMISPVLIIGNSEIVYCGVVTSGTVFTFTNRTSISHGSTPNITHEDEEEVRQGVSFNADPDDDTIRTGPFKMLLAILLTRRQGSTATHDFYDFAEYDSGFKGMGLGFPADSINIISFENADGIIRHAITDQSSGYAGRIAMGIRPEPAATWINNVLKSYNAFMYTDENGRLAVKLWDRIELLNSTSVSSIANNEIKQGAEMNLRLDEVLNHFEIAYNRNWLTGEYSARRFFRQGQSFSAYDLAPQPHVLEIDGFTASVSDDEVEIFLTKFAWTFADPPAFFKLPTGLDRLNIAPGDVITITANRFIDYSGSDAVQGWSSLKGMVTGQSLTWAGGLPQIIHEGFCWEVMDKSGLGSAIAIQDNYDTGDFDDSAIAIGSSISNTATLEADDAYVDRAGAPDTTDSKLFRLVVTITPPASPTNPDTVILFNIGVHAQNPAGTDGFAAVYEDIRYNTDDSAFNLTFHFSNESGNVTWLRFKVDAYDARQTDGTTAAAGDEATLTVVNLTTYNYNAASFTEIS